MITQQFDLFVQCAESVIARGVYVLYFYLIMIMILRPPIRTRCVGMWARYPPGGTARAISSSRIEMMSPSSTTSYYLRS